MRPASSTGEDVIELHGHGGRAVVDAVLAALAAIEGVRQAEPGEFTRRAFENGRIDLTEAEGLADLIEAETESQRKAALALAEGGLRKQIAIWQERLLALSAQAERAIDYDEEDEAVDPALLRECAGSSPSCGSGSTGHVSSAEGRRARRRRGTAERRKVKPYQCDSRGRKGDRHGRAGHDARSYRGAPIARRGADPAD